MSAATLFLYKWIALSDQHKPSVTMVTCQASADLRPLPQAWAPGVVSYNVGINGTIVRNQGAQPIGLLFKNVRSVFSDRLIPQGESPLSYQRFAAGATDRANLELLVDGDEVVAKVDLLTWGVNWTRSTTLTSMDGHQLLFPDVPPAGNVPVSAVMLISFQPSGVLAWLGNPVGNPEP